MRFLFHNYVALRAAGVSASRANAHYKEPSGKWSINFEGLDGPVSYSKSIGKYSIACDLAIKFGISLKINGQLITWADLKRAVQPYRKSCETKRGKLLGRRPLNQKDWHSASYQ